MPDLKNRIAIVTGASSGIGRAIALALSAAGATVTCADLNLTARLGHQCAVDPDANVNTHELILKRGGIADFVACDVARVEEVDALISGVVRKAGRLDIMINNAGISIEAGPHGQRPVWECGEAEWERNMGVNVKGVWAGVRAATRVMVEQDPVPGSKDRGWVLNIASVLGTRGVRGASGYVTSKHAVIGITKAAALDCAPHRVHVNVLCPGFTESALTAHLTSNTNAKAHIEARHPFGGGALGTVEDVAKAAMFLVSDDAAWITGVELPVDGGFLA